MPALKVKRKATDKEFILQQFAAEVSPLEDTSKLCLLTDNRTRARYCECHVKASKLVDLSTTDVPLDPDEQAEYRANREIVSDHQAFQRMKDDPRPKPDHPEKAQNAAILAAWAFVAGMLHDNETRLKRHYALRHATGKDPLNAAALAKGRHKTDPENYRGLGYRTDLKERGRFVELFYHQAETGSGITLGAIEVAIKQYHAKQAQLEVIKAKEKL